MNKGDLINGYEILQDFSVAGAGFSKWTFAAKEGREYFFKEFLSPTYPEPDAPGSEAIKARKRARCEAFENHNRRVMEATRPVSSLGGNLIGTLDFFRWGAKYYNVTEKVDVADGFDVAQVAALGFDDQLVILKSVAHSLKVLHDLGIVHGDLKPTNILIKKTALAHTAKLIDVDSAYFTGEPPPPDLIVGTINYYSPELLDYIQETPGTDPHRLGLPSDVFTLGLIYAEYLTGQLPAYDRDKYAYASTAARAGEVVRVPAERLRPDVPPAIGELLDRMLLGDPAARPTIAEVHAALMKVRRGDAADAPAPVGVEPLAAAAAAAAGATARPTSGLKGKGLRTVSPPVVSEPEAAAETEPEAAAETEPVAAPTEPATEPVAAAEPVAGTAEPARAAESVEPAEPVAATERTAEPVEPAPAAPEAAPKTGLLGKLVGKVRKTDPS